MSIIARRETLSTAAELLVSPDNATTDLPQTVTLSNGSAADIYIGGSNVTAGTNCYQVGQDTLTLVLAPGDSLYGIAGAGTPTIDILVTRG